MFRDPLTLLLDVIEPDNGSIGCLGGDDEMSIGIGVGVGGRVVVLGVVGVVVLFEGGPAWIVAVVECSMGGVEFVAEDQVVGSCVGSCGGGSCGVVCG